MLNQPLILLGDSARQVGSYVAARFRLVLVVLIGYQVVMYGWVARTYLHLSVVLLPWLLNQPGYRLYDNLIVNYTPGYLWVNAAFYQLIPDPAVRLRVGTIGIAAAITLLVFIQARRWWDTQTGLLAALLFALWGPLLAEYLLYFEWALGLLALLALMIWQRAGDSWRRPLIAGLLVGVMIVVKQTALAVILAFCLWRLLGRDWKNVRRDLVLFGAGIAVPLLLIVGVLALQGVLGRGLFLMTDFNRAYVSLAAQFPDRQDLLLLVLWLGLIPFFAYLTWRRHSARPTLRLEGVLTLGLLIALLIPAYPRYGRFHLSGALPFVALLSAGAIHLLSAELSRWLRWFGMIILALLLIVGAALPLYYRVKLGAATSQYEALLPVSAWVKSETDAAPGTRMWILPDIDPTGNFYPISGYEPPQFYVNNYEWYFAWSDLTEQVIAGLESDPPAYVIVVEQWRSQVTAGLWDYVQAHYTVAAQTEFPGQFGQVSLYRRIP